MTTCEDDEAGVAAFVERYRAGFATMDPELLITIWDRRHDGIVYVAQEIPAPIRGWAQVEACYRRLPTANPADRVIEMRVDDLSVDTLGDVARRPDGFSSELGAIGSTPPSGRDSCRTPRRFPPSSSRAAGTVLLP